MDRKPQPFLSHSSSTDVDIGAGPDSDTGPETDFRFWLGTRQVVARGEICDHHPNVVFLRVLPSTLGRLFHRLSRLLPATLSEGLEARWPEWFLPDRIVMKREKPNWEEEFDNEVDIYGLLAPLGGRVVPKLYGQTEYPGTDKVRRRALIMSDIGGVALGEPEVGSLPLDRVEEMLEEAFRALVDAGVGHCDAKPDNVHLVGDRVMLIDFDTSQRIQADEDPGYWVLTCVRSALRMYILHHRRFPNGIPWGTLPGQR